ncbi:MAG: C-terminal binding protein [Candidatus Nealsonbacteria bacterium]|nr:C-terminal binding protein [Candidatus Nealsonbacteria bacterium]
MSQKVVATYFLKGGDFRKEIIEKSGAEFVIAPCQNGDQIIAAAKEADAIVTASTFQPFTKEIIQRLEKVRHISSMGVGVDNIDLAAATKKRIVVTNTPFYCIDEVSDHAMALILALSRKLFPIDKAAKALRWRSNDHGVIREVLQPLKRLRGQTLGLIGFGNIAKTLVPKAKGFGLNVIAYDHSTPKEKMKVHFGVEKVGFEDLLKRADFVSLHVNLTPQNKKMFKEEHFRLMKPTAYFINTARGALVDEGALVMALTEKLIAGAGLDVMEHEPPWPNNPLLKMENVIITGHFAQYSDDSEEELWRIPLEEVVLTLSGKFPRFAVNQEVKSKWLKKYASPD